MATVVICVVADEVRHDDNSTQAQACERGQIKQKSFLNVTYDKNELASHGHIVAYAKASSRILVP